MKKNNFYGRSFLTLKDFTCEEILELLELAKALKQKKAQGIKGDSLIGKNIVLICNCTPLFPINFAC